MVQQEVKQPTWEKEGDLNVGNAIQPMDAYGMKAQDKTPKTEASIGWTSCSSQMATQTEEQITDASSQAPSLSQARKVVDQKASLGEYKLFEQSATTLHRRAVRRRRAARRLLGGRRRARADALARRRPLLLQECGILLRRRHWHRRRPRLDLDAGEVIVCLGEAVNHKDFDLNVSEEGLALGRTCLRGTSIQVSTMKTKKQINKLMSRIVPKAIGIFATGSDFILRAKTTRSEPLPPPGPPPAHLAPARALAFIPCQLPRSRSRRRRLRLSMHGAPVQARPRPLG